MMNIRARNDFSGVITDLNLRNQDIVKVPAKFSNAKGVYFNPKAKDGFQYVVAFGTDMPDIGGIWVEIYGVEKDGASMMVRGRAGSTCVKYDQKDKVHEVASGMIEDWLQSIN